MSDKIYTLFSDMHSGGGSKLGNDEIYIEAPEGEAANLFEEMFDRCPYNVTCTCCGPDYSVYIQDDPAQGSWVISRQDILRFREDGSRPDLKASK